MIIIIILKCFLLVSVPADLLSPPVPQMALKLNTVHRWCVTGTPISRGLEDLYGLFTFLRSVAVGCASVVWPFHVFGSFAGPWSPTVCTR